MNRVNRAILFLPGVLLVLLALSCARKQASGPEEAAVRSLLEHYFATWSAQDMDAYGACFHESARITFLPDRSGQVITETLTDFLHGQRMGHKTSATPMRETAESIDIQGDGRAALARVRWKLVKEDKIVTGIDHFSLVKTPAGWKIAHLLFYAD